MFRSVTAWQPTHCCANQVAPAAGLPPLELLLELLELEDDELELLLDELDVLPREPEVLEELEVLDKLEVLDELEVLEELDELAEEDPELVLLTGSGFGASFPLPQPINHVMAQLIRVDRINAR